MAAQDDGDTASAITGGTFSGPVLQGRFTNLTFVMSLAAAAPVALAQLPPLAAGFTGREAELAQVAGLLNPAGDTGPVVVSAVAGLAGVGKTTLAVHAAHAAQVAGWFGGGVLFINLHGYDPSPVQPGQALDALLRALGIPDEHIPEGTEQRAALYRSSLAQASAPVLVIIDNASAEAQVRPLLPGPGPHRVIVTSRHTLAGLGARLLDVTVLDQAPAALLLGRVLHAARPGDRRISDDQAAAARLASLCGGLPLALQIAAALLTADPVLSTAELADEMADEVRRLEALRYDDGSDAGALSVAAAFELSYRQLDEDTGLIFRLLPADPGPDLSTGAAAALAGWPPSRARAVLGRLARAHLVEAASVPGRWRMHDLLRLYARQVPGSGDSEREQAATRLLDWYYRRANAARAHLRAQPGKSGPGEFTGRDDALAWLDAQRPNLVAAVAMAAATGHDQEAMGLPIALSPYLSLRRRLDEWLTVLTISRDTARRLGDRDHEWQALNNLGIVLAEVRRFDEAIIACQDVTAILRDIGDRHGEGRALGNLGLALAKAGRVDEGITACQDAAAILRETDDRRGEGATLTNLGLALIEVRRFDEAITACQDAAAIFRETGDRHGEGLALGNLGLALAGVRRFDEGITACQDAAAIFREVGDRDGEADALGDFGFVLVGALRFDEAITACQDAAAIFREVGDRHGEGKALNSLGLALAGALRFDEAITTHQDAAAIYREVGDRHGEGIARQNLEDDRAARIAEANG